MKTSKLSEVEIADIIMNSIFASKVELIDIHRRYTEKHETYEKKGTIEYLNENEDLLINMLTQVTDAARAIVEKLFRTEKENVKKLLSWIEVKDFIEFERNGISYIFYEKGCDSEDDSCMFGYRIEVEDMPMGNEVSANA